MKRSWSTIKPYVIPCVLVVVWMAAIFFWSHQIAADSDRVSVGLADMVLQAIREVIPDLELEAHDINRLIRKNAHFLNYLILGVLAANALHLMKKGLLRSAWYAALFCVSYAVLDEIHQIFVPGRSAQVADVIIDSTGAMLGIILYLLLAVWRNHRKNGKKVEKT